MPEEGYKKTEETEETLESLSQADWEGKSAEELKEIKAKLGQYFVPGVSDEDIEKLNELTGEVDLLIAKKESQKEVEKDSEKVAEELEKVPEVEPEVEIEKEEVPIEERTPQRSGGSGKIEMEIDEEISKPLDRYSEEGLLDHINWLNDQLGYLERKRNTALAARVSGRLKIAIGMRNEEIKAEEGKEVKEEPHKEPQPVLSEEAKPKVEPEIQPEKQTEIKPEVRVETEKVPKAEGAELEKPKTIETPDAEAQEILAAAVTEDKATPEQAEVIQQLVKRSWGSVAKEYVMGLSIKEIAKNMATGAVVGATVKVGLRAAFGLGGVALSATGGALAAPGRKLAGAGIKQFRYWRAEKILEGEKAGDILEKVRKGKLSKVDALLLIEDRKTKLRSEIFRRVGEDLMSTGDPEALKRAEKQEEEILNIEAKLIENKEELEKLSGYDKIQEYIRISNTTESITEKGFQRMEELRSEVAKASGRRISMKEIGKAALWGAVGGAVGYTVAHAISGLIGHTPSGSVGAKPPAVLSHTPAHPPESINTVPIKVTPSAPAVPPINFHAEAAPLPHPLVQVEAKPVTPDVSNLHIDVPATPEVNVNILTPHDMAGELKMDEVTFLSADPAHTTVREVMNSIVDATKSGPKVDLGLAIDKFEPQGDEWNMTVEDFLKAHIHLAHVPNVETPHITAPPHEIAHVPHVEAEHVVPKVIKLPDVSTLKVGVIPQGEPHIDVHAPHIPGVRQVFAEGYAANAEVSQTLHTPDLPPEVEPAIPDVFNPHVDVSHTPGVRPAFPEGYRANEELSKTLHTSDLVPEGVPSYLQNINQNDLYNSNERISEFLRTPSLNTEVRPDQFWNVPEVVSIPHTQAEKSMFDWFLWGGRAAVVGGIGGVGYGASRIEKQRRENKKQSESVVARASTREEIQKLTPAQKNKKIQEALKSAVSPMDRKILNKYWKSKKYQLAFDTLELAMDKRRGVDKGKNRQTILKAAEMMSMLPGTESAYKEFKKRIGIKRSARTRTT
ncbi:hypothetical protein KW790_02960 [Candidatus Parcubacteria bacterium]|nr:hypothetical protein [Candidatus Parcubacteria bacterium]